MLATTLAEGPQRGPVGPAREDPDVEIPPPTRLIGDIRELPAVARLARQLGELDGVYLVGGAVRDLLLDGRPTDLDLVVDADAAEIARRLGPARIHDRFGTSTVKLGRFTYDIARARTETYPRPGALPEVAPADLASDLFRRDFTVNAMAVALGGEEAGELQTVPDAVEDLRARRLRVLHDGSFIDDPTRLLRLARYASRLGFDVEEHTLELALAAARAGALGTVSGPRIGAELRLAAREPDPVAAFQKLDALELDRAIAEDFGLTDTDAGLARRALELLPPDGRADLLVLGLAGRRMDGPALAELLDRLGFDARDRDVIAGVALRADSVVGALDAAGRPSQIAEALAGAPPELVAVVGALGPVEKARAWLERLRHVRLAIDGDDLVEAGVPEGPAVGAGLRAALAAKLDGAVSGRDAELDCALGAARGNG
jgi:tRNA nucleotidyltransferase (CCA-adding enzyme)